MHHGLSWDGVVDPEIHVGIDQSYTGFAVTLYWGCGSTSTLYELPKDGGIKRAMAAEEILDAISWSLDGRPIKSVVMEGYAYSSTRAHMAGELGAIVKRWWVTTYPDVPLLVASPTSLKKYVTGTGTAKKQQILLGVYKRWGVEFHDDNLADSYGLARMAAGDCTSKDQQAALDKLVSVLE